MGRGLTFRKTNLVIRCPHCGKNMRLVVALVSDESNVKLTVKRKAKPIIIEDAGDTD